MVFYQDKGNSVEESSMNVIVEETAPTSLMLKTLDELKKENEVVRERLDKQYETKKQIKEMLNKQE